MILTGKAKEDFEKWFFEYYNKDKISVAMFNHETMFKSYQELVQKAYIIEFFDSVGYTIDRDSFNKKMTITNWLDGLETQIEIDCDYFEPFKEWWEQAIIKANEIYNLNHK